MGPGHKRRGPLFIDKMASPVISLQAQAGVLLAGRGGVSRTLNHVHLHRTAKKKDLRTRASREEESMVRSICLKANDNASMTRMHSPKLEARKSHLRRVKPTESLWLASQPGKLWLFRPGCERATSQIHSYSAVNKVHPKTKCPLGILLGVSVEFKENLFCFSRFSLSFCVLYSFLCMQTVAAVPNYL